MNSAEDKKYESKEIISNEEVSKALDDYEERKKRVAVLKEKVQSGNYAVKTLSLAKKIFEKVFKQ